MTKKEFFKWLQRIKPEPNGITAQVVDSDWCNVILKWYGRALIIEQSSKSSFEKTKTKYSKWLREFEEREEELKK